MAKVVQVLRGGAGAVVAAGCVLAILLWTDVAPSGSIAFFALVAVAGVLYWLIQPNAPRMQSLGALLVGAGALGLGAGTGFGALEWSLIAGSVIALVLNPLATPDPRLRVRPWVVGLVGIGVAAIALVPLILDGGTLGHDESVYALKARSWLEGTPGTGWSLHRGPALSAYGYVVLAFGGEEPALRALGWVAVVGLALAVWWLGSKLGNRWVGPLSAVAVVSGPALLRRGTEFLTDIPAAALLVACMAIVWEEFDEKEELTFGLLRLLPLAWLAFYLRYQAILSFGLIGLMILLVFWKRVKAKPWPVVATSLVGLAGLIPHMVFSTAKTGSPIGILQFTGEVAGRAYLGEGLVDYAGLLGWRLAAFVGPIAAVLFLWWAVSRWNDPDSKTSVRFLSIPAVGQVLALGILSHGESRFVFFPLALTIIGGALGFFDLSANWRRDRRQAFAAGILLLLMASSALSVAAARRAVDNRVLSNEPVELAAVVIDEMDPADECAVMTSYLPQITFYSSCWTDRFRPNLEADEAVDRLQGDPRFMVLIEDGKRQPEGADLDELVDLTTEDPIAISGERDSALVYEFAP